MSHSVWLVIVFMVGTEVALMESRWEVRIVGVGLGSKWVTGICLCSTPGHHITEVH